MEVSNKLQSIKEIPEYASICSFIQLFGEELSISLTHKQIAYFLENEDNENVPKLWIDVHRRLLNRVKFPSSVDKWEIKLRKFLSNVVLNNFLTLNYNFTSYTTLNPKERAQILNLLLDAQFDRNIKFKEKVNNKSNDSLRIKPLGSDIYGCIYWILIDVEYNILIYKENLEEESFKIVAETLDDAKRLNNELKEINIESIDLSKLYKLPEESDSPLMEITNGNDFVVKNEMKLEKETELSGSTKLETSTIICDKHIKNGEHLEIKKSNENLTVNDEDLTDNEESENKLIINTEETDSVNVKSICSIKTEENITVDVNYTNHVETAGESSDIIQNGIPKVLEDQEKQDKELNERVDEEFDGNLINMECSKLINKSENDTSLNNVQIKENEKDICNKEEASVPTEVERKSENQDIDLIQEKCKINIDIDESNPVRTNEEFIQMSPKNLKKRNKKSKTDEDNYKTPKKNKQSEIQSQFELRRSSRQRKPVTFFTIGDLNSHCLKESEEEDEQVEKMEKKNKVSKGKRDVFKERFKTKSESKSKSLKESKRRRNKDKHLEKRLKDDSKKRKKKIRQNKRKKPWEAGESSDEEVMDHSEDLYLPVSDNSDEEYQNNQDKVDNYDNDKPESDFDINNLSQSSDEEMMKSRGRNYFRQKKRQCKTSKKLIKVVEEVQSQELEEEEEATLCQICLGSTVPEMMLLCDSCDLGHHAMCLRPALMIIPEGDWFCPKCCHTKLLEQLGIRIPELEKQSAKNVAKIRMQERLNFVNISMSNILSNNRSQKKKSLKKRSLYNSEDDNEELIDQEVNNDEDGNDSNSSTDDDRSSPSLTSSSDNENENESGASNSSSNDKPYKFRESIRKDSHKYNFEELDKMFDEALVYDEKYQMLKKRQESGITEDDDDEENDDDDDDDDDDNENDNKTDKDDKTSDSDYDYSGLVPRKKSSGKDIANVLQDDDDNDDEVKDVKNEEENAESQNDSKKIVKVKPPELVKASKKKRRLVIDDSCNEDGEDAKDADFRISEEEEDYLSDEQINSFCEEDNESDDDDWRRSSKRPTRRSTRINTKQGKSRHKSKSKRKETKSGHSKSRTSNHSRNKRVKNRNSLSASFGIRPRRNAAQKVNYREMIGEDENEDDEEEESYYDEENEKVPVSTDSRPPILTAMHPGDREPSKLMNVGENSPEFEPSDDDDEENECVENKDFDDNQLKAKERLGVTDKPPPVVARIKSQVSSRKKRSSESEYEASSISSEEEDDEEEEEVEDIEDEITEPGSDSTDKQETVKSPIKDTELSNTEEEEGPPVKIRKIEEPKEDESKETPMDIELFPCSQNEIISISTDLPVKVDETILQIIQPIPTPPILTAEDVDVCLKNPMRAAFKGQEENIEDEVDSDSELDMLSIKR